MGQVVYTRTCASEHWGSETEDNLATPSKEAVVKIWTEAKWKPLLNIHLPHYDFLFLQKHYEQPQLERRKSISNTNVQYMVIYSSHYFILSPLMLCSNIRVIS